MGEFELFAGEDFALLGQAVFDEQTDTSSSLDDFDIFLTLTTTAMGRKILCSTEPGADVVIKRRDDNFFAANISSALSSGLSSGTITVSIAFVHRQTGVKTIAEKKSI